MKDQRDKTGSEDSVFIDELEVAFCVGDSPKEKAFPQILKISVRVYTSLGDAGTTDRLDRTVDYAMIISQIKELAAKRDFNLVESVGEDIASIVLKYSRTRAVAITVQKKAFPDVKSVGIRIFRTQKGTDFQSPM
jgi:dihydroneopterin aldolase